MTARENRHFENDRGLAEYMHDEALKEKVYSLYPSVEIVDGELWGVMTAGLKEPLSGKETAVLLSFVEGQNADGYGEGFEQRPIKTPDGEVYVSFWDRGKRISRDLIVSHSVKIRYPFSDSGFLLSFAYVHTAWLSGSIKTALRSA